MVEVVMVEVAAAVLEIHREQREMGAEEGGIGQEQRSCTGGP